MPDPDSSSNPSHYSNPIPIRKPQRGLYADPESSSLYLFPSSSSLSLSSISPLNPSDPFSFGSLFPSLSALLPHFPSLPVTSGSDLDLPSKTRRKTIFLIPNPMPKKPTEDPTDPPRKSLTLSPYCRRTLMGRWQIRRKLMGR